MARALRLLALAAAAHAALYSDETYNKLRRLFGRVRQDPAPPTTDARYYQKVETALNEVTRKRLDELLDGATTEKCREEVTSAFIDSHRRMIGEDWLPFERTGYVSDCPSKSAEGRKPRLKAEDIRLVYLLVVHETPHQITRLIEALEEGTRHSFIIHVDDKVQSQSTQDYLLRYASSRTHVHVLEQGRQSVAWGGFNVVQATLNGLAYALDMLDDQFDWIVTMSGYTYPLGSNRRIREELARHPADTEFLEIRPQPNDPMPRAWHQFVECDGKMRRISRLLPPKKIKMYMGSQWMVITRDFAAYATGRDGPRRSFAKQYAPYAKYTMVADENYFTTVLKNAPQCRNHYNQNFLHVQFDQWESDKIEGPSANKCLQPDPRHCGRSPTTLTLDYMPVLELGGALFARKFDAIYDAQILDAIDASRAKQDQQGYVAKPRQYFESVRFVREANGAELCINMASHAAPNGVFDLLLKPCDRSAAQRFNIGPCSADGHIELRRNQYALVRPGDHAPAPFCPIAHIHGKRMTCFDLNGESIAPGTRLIGFPCNGRWNQLLALGTGARGQPDVGSVYINVPFPKHPTRHLCVDSKAPTNADPAPSLFASKCSGAASQMFRAEPVSDSALYERPAAPPRERDYLRGGEEEL